MRISAMISVNSNSTFHAEQPNPDNWIVVETMPPGSVSERSDRDRGILAHLRQDQAEAIAAILNDKTGDAVFASLVFTTSVAEMSTDTERQEGMDNGDGHLEAREEDTGTLDRLIIRARQATTYRSGVSA